MRHTNAGLRKICGHPRRAWAKCPDAWHFSFKWKEKHYRFSLDRHLGEHVATRSDAEELAADLRKQIRAGKFGQVTPTADLTLRQLADQYVERSVQVKHADTADDYIGGLNVICHTPLPRPTGGTLPFGDWLVRDIVADSIERYREARHAAGAGPGGCNRSLARLRAMFNWAAKVGYVDRTPFRREGQSLIDREREQPRGRRLDADHDEEQHILNACSPHLRGVVEAILAAGLRRGEVLGLQWRDIRGMTLDATKTPAVVMWEPRAALFLPKEKTKTREDREIPINARLRAVLEMRRFDLNGQPFGPDSYVFGNAIGQRVHSVTRAWNQAVLESHGHEAKYTKTGNLTPACRAALKIINLHLHDLRRESASRWVELGAPIHVAKDWLGHRNLNTTSTYLKGSLKVQHDVMTALDARLQELATKREKGAHNPPSEAEASEQKPSKTTGGRPTAIM